MKLLLDSAFAASLLEHSTPLLAIEMAAHDTGEMSDAELVWFAVQEGFDAVALLGHYHLASHPLRAAAKEAGIALVLTYTEEPVEAERQIAGSLRALVEKIGPGRVLMVSSSGVHIVLSNSSGDGSPS